MEVDSLVHKTGSKSENHMEEEQISDLQAQIDSVESENMKLILKLSKAKQSVEMMKFERRLLLEKLESIDGREIAEIEALNNDSILTDDSDANSSIENISYAKKRKRDPNLPKRPANPYFMFCQVVRDQVKAEYPDLGRTEMTRALAEKWKNLPEEEKQKYHDKYKQDKDKFYREMNQYQKNFPREYAILMKKKKKKSSSTGVTKSKPNVNRDVTESNQENTTEVEAEADEIRSVGTDSVDLDMDNSILDDEEDLEEAGDTEEEVF